jgi:pimeloyl-ACP methyl ester carboxylesterase
MADARDRFVIANRLRHHLLEWGDAGDVVVLLHGFLEHAHVWDWVAPRLAEAGYHIFALDWRGHGDSEWIGAGGYYHFPDYVADLSGVVRNLGGTAALVGHSMGGGAAILYAGTEPGRVTALVSIEGIGVPDSAPETAPERFATWLRDMEKVVRRIRSPLAIDAAVDKIKKRFPRFPPDAARHMALWGTREEDGRRVWKFDPLHQTRAPQPAYAAQTRAFCRRVTCPVLYVAGAESGSWLAEDDLSERLSALRARCVMIEGAGHHPHLERPELLSRLLIGFLRSPLVPS